MAVKNKVLFPEGDDTGTFIVPALDARAQVLSIKDRRNGVGKPSVQTCSFLETDSCLPLLVLICMFLVFLMVCCKRSSLKPARPMCDGRPFASPLFRRLAGRGPFFRGFPFRWALKFVFSHAYKWSPCPLSGRWLQLQDLICPALHLPMKIQ